MTARAVIIGIDAYEGMPLESCVRDAHAMRDVLLELGLVQPDEITVLTAPADDPAQLATSANMGKALFEVYDKGAETERLYVFYSGHGLMAQVGAARSRLDNYLIPCDVTDPRMQGNLLVNVDDLRARLRMAGPKEQFLFLDCCRNVAWGDPPELGPLAWPRSTTPSDPANAQATLFAVSPRGKAIARDGTTSLVTEHLVDAVRGRGAALDWSESDGTYVVTIESIRNHVRQAVRTAIEAQPLWGRDNVLPDCEVDGTLSPFRVVPEPEPVPLTVNIEPPEAAATTRVRLTKGGDALAEPAWPPEAAGAQVLVRPQRFGIMAESDAGAVSAQPAVVDARVVSVAVVRVGEAPAADTSTPADAPTCAPSTADSETTGVSRGTDDAGGHGSIKAIAEPHVSIEARRLDPPYGTQSGIGSLIADVAPGFYRVRFRLGSELFSETEVEISPGQELLVQPNVVSSPLLLETLAWDGPQRDAVVSDTVGPMQGGVVETLLAMLAVKPFDASQQLFKRFDGVVPAIDPATLGGRPLSLVLAVDGAWTPGVAEVLGGITAEVAGAGGGTTGVELVRLRDEPTGLGRVAIGFGAPALGASTVRLRSPHLGAVDLAVGALDGRATVVTLLFIPNGSLLVAQHLLPLPGAPVSVGPAPYASMVRALAVGQQLYRAGELVANGTMAGGPLGDVLAGKFVDPVVTTMAAWSWHDAGRKDEAERLAQAALQATPGLPDAAVLAAVVHEDTAALDSAGGAVTPLLARSCDELRSRQGPPSTGGAIGRLDPKTTWNLTWEET